MDNLWKKNNSGSSLWFYSHFFKSTAPGQKTANQSPGIVLPVSMLIVHIYFLFFLTQKYAQNRFTQGTWGDSTLAGGTSTG